MDSPNQFWIRAILVFLSIIGIVILGRYLMLPDSWGQYGYYRGAYVDQEANKPLIHGTNQSCISCHNEVVELQNYHSHKNLSCETCHSSINTHIENGKKIADMDIKQGENQVNLCLKCHQKTVGRPENFPMIDRFEHLDKLKVKNTHTCDQCHTVHAPLENIDHVKKLRMLKETINEK